MATPFRDYGGERWTARADGLAFEAATEEGLRDAVRAHLVAATASQAGVPEADLTARLTRTWRVRVVAEARKQEAAADEEEGAVWSLFD